MIGVALFALLLQGTPNIPVQLGVRADPDTVTVGQRFVVIVRVRVPRGATVEFPVAVDSSASASPTATELLGKPATVQAEDSTGVTFSAAYRFAAWDVGAQKLGLPDITVHSGDRTGFVSLARQTVFVKSVLPADTTKRKPKPARPPIVVPPFNWLPWLIALAALIAGYVLWRVFIWYRRRRNAPLDPYSAAEKNFDRIVAMRLPESGEPERHAALMSDVMRTYLAARVPEIERSYTSSELLAAAPRIHSIARGMGELLWRTDLIKFANLRVDRDEAERLGSSARELVGTVEDFLSAEEDADERSAA
jgi:hypothetical protein